MKNEKIGLEQVITLFLLPTLVSLFTKVMNTWVFVAVYGTLTIIGTFCLVLDYRSKHGSGR